MTNSKNFSKKATPHILDTEYTSCNFAQVGETDGGTGWKPTRIFPDDDTPRTFIECNMVNALPPVGSTLINCNTLIIEYREGEDVRHGKTHPTTLAKVTLPAFSQYHTPPLEALTISVTSANKAGLLTALSAMPSVEKIKQ